MNAWLELKKRHQKETDSFPIHFAFGDEQIKRKIKELNLDLENWRNEIRPVGYGGFVLKQDFQAMLDMAERHKKEKKAAVDADPTGDGIIFEMFYYELKNHEYGYTGELEDTLDYLGYTNDDIANDPRLEHGLSKACKQIMKEEGAFWYDEEDEKKEV